MGSSPRIGSALRRVVGAGEAPAARAEQALDDLLSLPIERYPHGPLMARVWELRDVLTGYDATYLALAEGLSRSPTALLTTDAAFARAVGAASDVEPLLVR